MKMLVYMYQSHLQTLILKHQTLHNLNHCLIRPIIHTYSTTKRLMDSSEFKISFLKNKCGLSGKALVRACKYLNFNSSDQRPDSVLDLFRTFGFPLSSITKIIYYQPTILTKYHPQNIIKPKLDFLLSISHSQADVVAVVTKTPKILTTSLNNYLKPSLSLLNSVTGSYPNTLSVLKHNPFILRQNVPKYFLLNTQLLVTLGVPHSQILKLLRYCDHALAEPHDKFHKHVSKLTDMGFDLYSSYFLNALRVLSSINDSAWKCRWGLFRSFGFSDHEIHSMFRKLPQIMAYTEKTSIKKLEFFMNKLKWTSFMLSSNPTVIAYSLGKRTIPRCSILQVLVSKKGTRESYALSTILAVPERKFVEDFVNAHKDELPEVMEAYKGNLRFDEYTFQQKGQLR